MSLALGQGGRQKLRKDLEETISRNLMSPTQAVGNSISKNGEKNVIVNRRKGDIFYLVLKSLAKLRSGLM